MSKGPNFMAMAKAVENRKGSARHQRRAAEKLAGKSVPALKKIIRRNKQQNKGK